MTISSENVVKSKSLQGASPAPHVAEEDVDSFLELIAAGVVPSAPMRCNAVQDNVSLRRETRTSLSDGA